VIVGTPDGSHFRVSLTQLSPRRVKARPRPRVSRRSPGQQNPIQGQVPGGAWTQPIGTVRAYAIARRKWA